VSAVVAAASPTSEGIEATIYRSVFESVMQQRLAPGTKLPESSLCELFGVSRTVVRKVLQRLAHDHIVELRPHRGASVAVPTAEDTRQIFEARHVVEAATVRLAARHATADDVAGLRRQLDDEHQAVHRFDQPAWTRLASSFHLRIAALSRNSVLQRYLEEIVSRCSLIVALYEPPGNAACEHDEHERIVDRIASRDGDGAVALMAEHLRILERNIVLRRASPDRSLRAMLGIAR
jgi:DNA-binding GntR family transcriptional regulator